MLIRGCAAASGVRFKVKSLFISVGKQEIPAASETLTVADLNI